MPADNLNRVFVHLQFQAAVLRNDVDRMKQQNTEMYQKFADVMAHIDNLESKLVNENTERRVVENKLEKVESNFAAWKAAWKETTDSERQAYDNKFIRLRDEHRRLQTNVTTLTDANNVLQTAINNNNTTIDNNDRAQNEHIRFFYFKRGLVVGCVIGLVGFAAFVTAAGVLNSMFGLGTYPPPPRRMLRSAPPR